MSRLSISGRSAGRRSSGRLACVVVLCTAVLGCVLPQVASAEPEASVEPAISSTPSTTQFYYVCPHGTCQAISGPPAIHTTSGAAALPDGTPLVGTGKEGGYTPKELQSAYKIPEKGGPGQTIAVIDGYGDETAESDLAEYRKAYNLYYKGTETGCTKTNGCFKKVNEKGEEAKYPPDDPEGEIETSIDLDMVSAACPECHILLLETSSEAISALAGAVNKAVELGATEVTESYSAPEAYEPFCGKTGCDQYNSDYDHPEGENSKHEKYPVVIFAAAGDHEYDNDDFQSGLEGTGLPSFPATSPYVVAVGGTSLEKAENARGWSEKVWAKTDSGCSGFESKTNTWQKETEEKEGLTGCSSNRTGNDIAADASCTTPVSIYTSLYKRESEKRTFPGWGIECGTSASTPFVAGIEAHSPKATKSLAAHAFYKTPSMLFHISEGSNGGCGTESEAKWYLCHATKEGYNGPTGMGTPDGVFGAVPPTVTTGSATGVTETEATLHGTVNPNGTEATTYHFEYGTTTSYGKTTAEAPAGSGESSVEVSKAITGLTKSTTYDYRIVATNGNGETSKGSNQVFTPGWSVQELPLPKSGEGRLEGVSCTSSTVCTAVGYSGDPLVESLSGTTWSVQEPPAPTEAEQSDRLEGVSCTSSKACTAVGSFYSKAGKYMPLAENWNGTTWSLQEVPIPTGSKKDQLFGVSCTSSTACMAVGEFENSAKETVPLAEQWNGTSWTVQEPPPLSSAKQSGLASVSCTASTECTAVGFSGVIPESKWQPLADRWNGTTWSAQEPPVPTKGTHASLYGGVSCTSSKSCVGVGDFINSSGKEESLAESWNGTTWTAQEPPATTGAQKTRLDGVSCTSSSACTAVGTFFNSANKFVPLAEIWNGTAWTAQEPPLVTGVTEGVAVGVSCTSSTACTAMVSFSAKPLAETYR
jgi:hypothetical protein